MSVCACGAVRVVCREVRVVWDGKAFGGGPNCGAHCVWLARSGFILLCAASMLEIAECDDSKIGYGRACGIAGRGDKSHKLLHDTKKSSSGATAAPCYA